jgi:hypothetical protein
MDQMLEESIHLTSECLPSFSGRGLVVVHPGSFARPVPTLLAELPHLFLPTNPARCSVGNRSLLHLTHKVRRPYAVIILLKPVSDVLPRATTDISTSWIVKLYMSKRPSSCQVQLCVKESRSETLIFDWAFVSVNDMKKHVRLSAIEAQVWEKSLLCARAGGVEDVTVDAIWIASVHCVLSGNLDYEHNPVLRPADWV